MFRFSPFDIAPVLMVHVVSGGPQSCRYMVWFEVHGGALKPFEPTSDKETKYKSIVLTPLGEEASRCIHLIYSPKP